MIMYIPVKGTVLICSALLRERGHPIAPGKHEGATSARHILPVQTRRHQIEDHVGRWHRPIASRAAKSPRDPSLLPGGRWRRHALARTARLLLLLGACRRRLCGRSLLAICSRLSLVLWLLGLILLCVFLLCGGQPTKQLDCQRIGW